MLRGMSKLLTSSVLLGLLTLCACGGVQPT